jgi:hypothetical protein
MPQGLDGIGLMRRQFAARCKTQVETSLLPGVAQDRAMETPRGPIRPASVAVSTPLYHDNLSIHEHNLGPTRVLLTGILACAAG